MILDVSFRRSLTAVSFLFEQLGNLERTLSLEESWSHSEDREALATTSTTSTPGQDFLRHLQVLNFARNSAYRFALTPPYVQHCPRLFMKLFWFWTELCFLRFAVGHLAEGAPQSVPWPMRVKIRSTAWKFDCWRVSIVLIPPGLVLS